MRYEDTRSPGNEYSRPTSQTWTWKRDAFTVAGCKVLDGNKARYGLHQSPPLLRELPQGSLVRSRPKSGTNYDNNHNPPLDTCPLRAVACTCQAVRFGRLQSGDKPCPPQFVYHRLEAGKFALFPLLHAEFLQHANGCPTRVPGGGRFVDSCHDLPASFQIGALHGHDPIQRAGSAGVRLYPACPPLAMSYPTVHIPV